MGLTSTVFAASVVGFLWCCWHFWRRGTGSNVLDASGNALPLYVDATFAAVALIGIVSTAPGLFFDEPHWAIDHVWRLIARMSGNAV